MARQIRPGQLQENVLYNISASFAISASHEITHELSSSYAESASFAVTASHLLNNPPAFPFTGSAGISGSLIVNSNSTSETLRITQIGTGDAIRIEDSSNPDSTPTVITKDGDMFIGSSSSVTTVSGLSPKLYIKNGSSGYSGDLAIDTAMLFEGSGATYFGTLSPDNVVSGLYMGSPSDVFGSVIRWGYDAGNLQLIAASVGHGITFQVGNKTLPSLSIIPNISSTSDYNATVQVTGSLTVSGSGFIGSGAGLTDIPASSITGLNLSQISSGSVSASIAPDKGFEINTNITASGNISVNGNFSEPVLIISGSQNSSFGSNSSTDKIRIGGNPGESFTFKYNTSTSAIGFVSPLLQISGSGGSSSFNPNIILGNASTIAPIIGDNVIVPFSFYVGTRFTTPDNQSNSKGTNQFVISGSDGNAGGGVISLGKHGIDPSGSSDIFLNGHVQAAGHITASGNISSSGTIVASNLSGTNTGDQDLSPYMLSANTASFAVTGSDVIFANITASGNISASGVYTGDGSGLTNIPASGITGLNLSQIASGSTSASTAPNTGVVVEHSGSTAFSVIGDVGTLFSVDDSLTGTLFSVNDISGFPVLQAEADGDVYLGKSPQSLYTTAVISSNTANITQSIYGISTSSYAGAFIEYTAFSGSHDARAGSLMAIWSGSAVNFTETTTTDFGDTSNLLMQVAISQSQAQVQSYSTTAGYKIKTIIKAI